MKSIFFKFLPVLVLSLMSSSCMYFGIIETNSSVGKKKQSIDEKVVISQKIPFVGILYYPYLYKKKPHPIATAVPDYSSWHNTRMLRDLERMGGAEIDAVITTFCIEDIFDKKISDRYLKFIELAGSQKFYPRVSFLVDSKNADDTQIHQFLQWCLKQNIMSKKGFFNYKGRPLIIFKNVSETTDIFHPAFTIRKIGTKRSDWSLRTTIDPQKLQLYAKKEQGIVYTSFQKNGNWLIDRDWRGREFKNFFRKTVALHPDILLIASWNDYENGAFAEPNSMDENTMYDRLCSEILRLKYPLKKSFLW
ncbi:MAG: hypothetical protein U9O87_02745 [Verrucomicrobiota bacterium]|nr:hypothetical protein [Verrucomicrobiota bacterium]